VVRDRFNGRLLEDRQRAAFSAALGWVAGRTAQQRDALRQAACASAADFSLQRTAEKALSAYAAIQPCETRGPAEGDKGQQALDRVISLIKAEWDIVKGMAEAGGAALRRDHVNQKTD
jgi:hypothetical protein